MGAISTGRAGIERERGFVISFDPYTEVTMRAKQTKKRKCVLTRPAV